jgi:asparagine synthase (glutamine-hydrolysing)
MDSSLYLLFKAIREHSTVALSGESADEVFGGYRWFHDPEVQQAKTFPWLGATPQGSSATLHTMLAPELVDALRLPDYVAAEYDKAVEQVPVLDGEDAFERRMREICHLHLTRFMRILLDRKDRMSMAVGLEVRVPFCDHRLVEYVFNSPWSLKTFDGREKSLLRHATANVLPRSVAERVKSPYPSTQDPRYAKELQAQVRQLVADSHPGLALFSDQGVRAVLDTNPEQIDFAARHSMEYVLNAATWFDLYKPVIQF